MRHVEPRSHWAAAIAAAAAVHAIRGARHSFAGPGVDMPSSYFYFLSRQWARACRRLAAGPRFAEVSSANREASPRSRSRRWLSNAVSAGRCVSNCMWRRGARRRAGRIRPFRDYEQRHVEQLPWPSRAIRRVEQGTAPQRRSQEMAQNGIYKPSSSTRAYTLLRMYNLRNDEPSLDLSELRTRAPSTRTSTVVFRLRAGDLHSSVAS